MTREYKTLFAITVRISRTPLFSPGQDAANSLTSLSCWQQKVAWEPLSGIVLAFYPFSAISRLAYQQGADLMAFKYIAEQII
jgi:hypothetical protein